MITHLGDHVFIEADIEVDPIGTLLKRYGPPSLVYSDLPYNPGIARVFRGWVDDARAVDFEGFLRSAFSHSLACRGPVCFEIGVDYASLCGVVGSAYWPLSGVYDVTYGRGKGNAALCVFNWPDAPDFTGVDSWQLPGMAIREGTNPGDVVSDLCVGLGLTAREAVKQGRRFVGSELNADRLARTVKSVKRIIDKEARHGER